MLAKLGLRQHTPLLQDLIRRFLDLAAAKGDVSTGGGSAAAASSSGGSQLQDKLSSTRRSQEAMLLWCMAVLDMREPAHLTRALLRRLQGTSELSTAAMAQLVQVQMWLQVSRTKE
jgi:hypothetical protein